MIEPTIYGLSNEQYHRGEEERQYLSSSLLKKYLISPKAYKYAIDNPEEEKSDALRFGSLFHDLMAALAEGTSMSEVLDAVAVFEPPINESRGAPYTPISKPYKDAYAKFIESTKGILVASNEDKDMVSGMLNSLLYGSGATSEQVSKLLRWGKPEVSFFYEFTVKNENGEDVTIRLKVRPDLLTDYKIIDWKTVSTDDLSEESINSIILKYGYHISAAMYQWVVWKVTGVWRDFYLVIVSKIPPYDCVMANMCAVLKDIYDRYHYGYGYCIGEDDIVVPGCGAKEFRKLLDLHIQCVKNNKWPGTEINIPEDRGARVLQIQPPYWYENKIMGL